MIHYHNFSRADLYESLSLSGLISPCDDGQSWLMSRKPRLCCNCFEETELRAAQLSGGSKLCEQCDSFQNDHYAWIIVLLAFNLTFIFLSHYMGYTQHGFSIIYPDDGLNNDYNLSLKWKLAPNHLCLSLNPPGSLSVPRCWMQSHALSLILVISHHCSRHIFRWAVTNKERRLTIVLYYCAWQKQVCYYTILYYQYCLIGRMHCMHHSTSAAYSLQHDGIGLSSTQPCFFQAALITKSLASMCNTSLSFRITVSWFSAGLWDEQMLLFMLSSFSAYAERVSHSTVAALWALDLSCTAAPQKSHNQNNINMSTSPLILQRCKERLQEQPSCQKPLLSCSPSTDCLDRWSNQKLISLFSPFFMLQIAI